MDKINGRKNVLLFLSRAPTHHSFIFNLRLLYELKYKARFSKTVCEIFHFQFCFVFIKVYTLGCLIQGGGGGGLIIGEGASQKSLKLLISEEGEGGLLKGGGGGSENIIHTVNLICEKHYW